MSDLARTRYEAPAGLPMHKLLQSLKLRDPAIASSGPIGDRIVNRVTDDSRDVTEDTIFALTELGRPYLTKALEKNPAGIVLSTSMARLVLEGPVDRNHGALNRASNSPMDLATGTLESLKGFRKQGLLLYSNRPVPGRPERILSSLARILHDDPDDKLELTAVTGTNGKTSISRMLYFAWKSAGIPCAVIGTLGATFFNGTVEQSIETGYTTPRSYQLIALLDRMLQSGIEKVVLEASSEALALGRLEGIRLKQAVFCGLSVDHLDYHGSMGRYFASKAHLFTILARSRGRAFIQNLSSAEPDPYAQKLERYLDRLQLPYESVRNFESFELSVPVDFNLRNANLAYRASGLSYSEALFKNMPDVPGRMNLFPVSANLDAIIDYAHTPDALERILKQLALRTYDELICVFGCGGDRDSGKRPMMGEAAMKYAHHVIVTDDNPRTEDPGLIRSQILQAREALKDQGMRIPELEEVADRRQAILHALESGQEKARSGKSVCVLVAGKGHEDYQIYGREKRPFLDEGIVREYISGL